MEAKLVTRHDLHADSSAKLAREPVSCMQMPYEYYVARVAGIATPYRGILILILKVRKLNLRRLVLTHRILE
jgi:hypothetical protein